MENYVEEVHPYIHMSRFFVHAYLFSSDHKTRQEYLIERQDFLYQLEDNLS